MLSRSLDRERDGERDRDVIGGGNVSPALGRERARSPTTSTARPALAMAIADNGRGIVVARSDEAATTTHVATNRVTLSCADGYRPFIAALSDTICQ